MNIIRVLNTFLFITVTWVFFRSQDFDTAIARFRNVFTNFHFEYVPAVIAAYYKVFLLMAFGYLTHWFSGSLKDKWRDKFIDMPHWVHAVVVLVVIFAVYQSICSDMQAFIYFQF